MPNPPTAQERNDKRSRDKNPKDSHGQASERNRQKQLRERSKVATKP